MLAAPNVARASCPDLFMPEGEVWAGDYRLRYRFRPNAPRVSENFSIDVAICSADEPFLGPLKVDADMPKHRHGLNHRPHVAAVAAGAYRVEGMVMHMAGDWRLKFELRTRSGPLRLESRYRMR